MIDHTGFGVFAYNFRTKYADITGECSHRVKRRRYPRTPYLLRVPMGAKNRTSSLQPYPGKVLISGHRSSIMYDTRTVPVIFRSDGRYCHKQSA